ncbi:MAG: FliM/FliN family flagellar motor switch protein [Blastocatellia bacterium]
MAEPIENHLFTAFSDAWSEAVPAVIGASATLAINSQREIMGDEVKAALAETRALGSVFAAKCFGDLSGIIVCFFKKEDSDEIDGFLGSSSSGLMKSLVSAALTNTGDRLGAVASTPCSFGDVVRVDLASLDNATAAVRLKRGVGEWIWMSNYTMDFSGSLSSDVIVIYASQGSLEALQGKAAPQPKPAPPPAATAASASGTGMPMGSSGGGMGSADAAVMSASAPVVSSGVVTSATRARASVPTDEASRKIERLLDVELEVVVRFGLTHIPLRELVRIGVGTMIELNRQVDEPVELLVNNYPLARGSVVVVDGYYGVCITEIGQPEERRLSLAKA